MTSGNFAMVSVALIKVDRAARQRTEVGDVSDLVDSIRRLGLIHPIVVDRGLNLIAGERRLAAHFVLGAANIAVQYADTLDPTERHCVELEENIKRIDLAWQDRCRAIQEYHELRKAEAPKWTQQDTAEALGLGQRDISHQIMVAEELAKGGRVTEAKNFSEARGTVERQRSRADEETLRTIRAVDGAPTEPVVVDSVLVADFLTWAPAYTGPRFNFLHCDFPYGIDAGEFNQGGARKHGGYEDSFSQYQELMSCLRVNLNKICTDSAHMIFWFSMKHYESTFLALEAMHGWEFDEFPLIWHKTDNTGIAPRPHHAPRRVYETAFFGWRGDRKTVKSAGNAHGAPTLRDIHMSIKPEPMLKHFFSLIVDQNTLMLDPTAGSGSALRAAESLGARSVLGLEKDPEFARLANFEIVKARKLRSVKA